jgi:hypothetical protein
MKKNFTIGLALALLCAGFQSANAGLLGMPLNLKTAMAHADPDRSTSPAIFRSQFFLFYAGDVADQLPISRCDFLQPSIVRCRIELA